MPMTTSDQLPYSIELQTPVLVPLVPALGMLFAT
jgi:hypothetical protein